MQCECWVWMAVRHLKDRVLHIISWISFDMGLKPTGCRPVNLFFYNMIKHRPDVSVQHLVCFTVSLWWHERRVKRKRDIYCFNDNNHGCELCRLVHLLMFWVDISLSFISLRVQLIAYLPHQEKLSLHSYNWFLIFPNTLGLQRRKVILTQYKKL